VEGGIYEEIRDLDDGSLASLIDPERHERIRKALLARKDDYRKVIVYAGTRELARSLYEFLANSELTDHYDSISYVLGDENSRGIDREEFFSIEKALVRSILINVQVLSEGYDDPRINTVVMAAPTNSKLVYMQALGRAIRHDPEDSSKHAYVVEVEDRLPNIRYRIDNRWLFSDMSDVLEPSVDDREFGTPEEFKDVLKAVFDEYRVEEHFRCDLPFNPANRTTILLFKYTSQTSQLASIPIIIGNDTRLTVANMFNFLSQRMRKFAYTVHPNAAFKMVSIDGINVLESDINRTLIYNAMEAQASMINGEATPNVQAGYPWITFISLRWRRARSQLPEDLINFAADMINGEEMLAQVAAGDYEPGFYMIKLPLPLSSTVGRIVPAHEFEQVQGIADRLSELKSECASYDHRSEADAIQNEAVWPLEMGLISSMVLIVRDTVDYYRELTK